VRRWLQHRRACLAISSFPSSLPVLPATIVRGRDTDSGTFYAIFSTSNPDIGENGYTGLQQRGACIMRSEAPEEPASWRAWDGQGYNVQVRKRPGDCAVDRFRSRHAASLPVLDCPGPRPLLVVHLRLLPTPLPCQFLDPYTSPISNVSAHVCAPINSSMIIVSVGWSVAFGAYMAGGFGSYRYPNGTDIPCCGAWLYALSDDLINWTPPQLVRPNKQAREGEAAAAHCYESTHLLGCPPTASRRKAPSQTGSTTRRSCSPGSPLRLPLAAAAALRGVRLSGTGTSSSRPTASTCTTGRPTRAAAATSSGRRSRSREQSRAGRRHTRLGRLSPTEDRKLLRLC